MKDRNKYTKYDQLVDWVSDKFSDEDLGPSKSQFSTYQVVDIILSYEKAKLNGELKKYC